MYISPEGSSSVDSQYLENVYSLLLSDIEKFSRIGDIIIQGDFNAYTNVQPDYVQYDNETKIVNLDDTSYQYDNKLNKSRNNLDHKHINKSGKFLLEMCKECGVNILNGRTTGDMTGKPTCITYNGSSLVDYCLVNKSLQHSVGYFEVKKFTVFSNHCPISCALFTNFLSL